MIAILSILIVFHLTFSFLETCLAYKFYYMKKERKKNNGILNPKNTGIYINQTNRFGETEFSWRHIEIHASVLRTSVLTKMFREQTEGGAGGGGSFSPPPPQLKNLLRGP